MTVPDVTGLQKADHQIKKIEVSNVHEHLVSTWWCQLLDSVHDIAHTKNTSGKAQKNFTNVNYTNIPRTDLLPFAQIFCSLW